MIDEGNLLRKASGFRDIRQIEKDYLLTMIPREISSVFTTEIIFKGGTCLKYFYNLNRFSEDLDFAVDPSRTGEMIGRVYDKINAVFDNLNEQYSVVEREHRGHREGDNVVGVNFEIRVRWPLNARTGQLQNIKIDLSTGNDLVLEPDTKFLLPQYEDITVFSILVMKVDEIVSEKVAAILEKSRMRDIYDLYFLLHVRGAKFNEELVISKMEKRNESFDRNNLIRKISEANNKKRWKSELSYLVDPLPEISEVTDLLNKIIEEDFFHLV